MIVIPNLDNCVFMTDRGFCVVSGNPYEIFEKCFIKRTSISDCIELISPIDKNISIMVSSEPIAMLYQSMLQGVGLHANLIQHTDPKKFFKEIANGKNNCSR